MRRLCAWCGADLGECPDITIPSYILELVGADTDQQLSSHGACEECTVQLVDELAIIGERREAGQRPPAKAGGEIVGFTEEHDEEWGQLRLSPRAGQPSPEAPRCRSKTPG